MNPRYSPRVDLLVTCILSAAIVALGLFGLWLSFEAPESDYQRLNAIELRVDALEGE